MIAGTAEGIDAVFFYLVTYGVATVAVFGVLSGLQRHGREVETLDDLSGLWKRHPGMAFVLALSAFSMLGLPPLLGFWGKLDIVIAGISAGETPLVVIMMATSAVSAYYYLHLAGLPVIRKPDARTEGVEVGPSPWPRIAGMVFGIGILILPFGARKLMEQAEASTASSWLEPAETTLNTEEARPVDQTTEIPRA